MMVPDDTTRFGSVEWRERRLRLRLPETHVHLAVHRRRGGEETAEAEVTMGHKGARRVRAAPAPTSSNTSTGSASLLTGTDPSGMTWTKPSARCSVAAVSRMLPGA